MTDSFCHPPYKALLEKIKRNVVCFCLTLENLIIRKLLFFLSKYHPGSWPTQAGLCDVFHWGIAKMCRGSWSMQPLRPGWRVKPLGNLPSPSGTQQCLLSTQTTLPTPCTGSVKGRNTLINMKTLHLEALSTQWFHEEAQTGTQGF